MDLGKGVTIPFSEKLIMKPVSKEIILLAANIGMSLKTQLLCGFRLFYLHEPSWILVIQRNLQTVDAF